MHAHCRRSLLLLVPLVLVSAAPLSSPALTGKGEDQESLAVDPLLIALAAEAWTVLAREDNPVWPGWNAADTPLLFYRPGVQDVLVNHPSPPEGFQAFEGVPDFLDWDVDAWDLSVRSGETLIELDGQNTSRSIGGVETLVVADTLSNGHTQLDTLLKGAREGSPAPEDLVPYLLSDSYDQLAMIAHEAFHVFQAPASATKASSEMLLLDYPVLSVENNVGFAQEGRYLGEALRAGTSGTKAWPSTWSTACSRSWRVARPTPRCIGRRGSGASTTWPRNGNNS